MTADQATLTGDLLAGNSPLDCSAPSEIDHGYNIDHDGSCDFVQVGDISDDTTLGAKLGPLTNNGGPTKTIALLAGNRAIDQIPAKDCPPRDQRGVQRTPPCDMGAYDTDIQDAFASANHTSASVGTFFSFSIKTRGMSLPKIKKNGQLPKGVKFNGHTDTLSGIPKSTTRKTAVGTYHLTFVATFGKGKQKAVLTQAFTLTVT